MVAIDDLHWSDHPSLRFVVHLASRIAELPVVLLLASRPVGSEPSGDHDLLLQLAAARDCQAVRLAPLSEAACTELVRSRLSRDADEGLCEALYEVSRGNPFFVRALIDDLAAGGVELGEIDTSAVRRMTPRAVSDTVLARLAALPAGALELARAVTILGASATFHLSRRLAQLDPDEAAAAAQALARARILGGESTIEFVHPLVRAAVYADLPAVERGRWHERAAALLSAGSAAGEELAPRLLASLPDGNAGEGPRRRVRRRSSSPSVQV